MPADALATEVRRIALPAIVTSLLATLVFAVDRVMLGRYSETSLAAMQIAGPVEWSLTSVFLAFEVGTIARVGRHIGARDAARARRAALLSFAVAVVAGACAALLWPVVSPHVEALFELASPAAVADARPDWTLVMVGPVVKISEADLPRRPNILWLGGKSYAGELLDGDVWQEGFGVDVNGMAAGWLDDGDAGLGNVIAEIGSGCDAIAEIVLLQSFLNADGDRFKVAAGESTISRISLGENEQVSFLLSE